MQRSRPGVPRARRISQPWRWRSPISLRGSKVDRQGYRRDPDFVASYERDLTVGGRRVGRSSLLFVFAELNVGRTEAATRATFQTLRVLVGTRRFREALARELSTVFEVSSNDVTVGRPRALRIGDGATSLPLRIETDGLGFPVVLTFMHVDRVLNSLAFYGFPERKIYNADVDRLARAGAARMKAGLVPVSKAPPLVSGTPQPGQGLSATRGTWTGDQLAFSFQWERCDAAGAGCTPLPGATSATYTVTSGDLASTLRVTVVGRNRLGSIATSSGSTSVVAGPPGSPTSTATPLLSGTAQVGATLTVDTGAWTGSPISFAYQWRRCNAAGSACLDVAGATASTYTVAANDSRSTLRAHVVATNASGSGGAVSAATAPVP